MPTLESLFEMEEDFGFHLKYWGKYPAPTAIMLHSVWRNQDVEAILPESQHMGLIAKEMKCLCGESMEIQKSENCVDQFEWECSVCHKTKSLKDSSWLEWAKDVDLITALLVLNYWSANNSEETCEILLSKLVDPLFVSMMYQKCRELSSSYFAHEMSKIGRKGGTVLVQLFRRQFGFNFLAGIDLNHLSYAFIATIPYRLNEWRICNVLLHHISDGTVVYCNDIDVHRSLRKIGKQYLLEKADIKFVHTNQDLLSQQDCLHSMMEDIAIEKIDHSKQHIEAYLLKQRLISCEDPFLFVVKMINIFHPLSSYEQN